MKNEKDFFMMKSIINDLGYTGDGDKDSKRKTFFTKILPKLVEEIQNKTFDEITNDCDDLQGEGVKNIIPSKIIDIYTRLELLLGLKLSGHIDTLTEASNLYDELYRIGDIQNEQQNRNALDRTQSKRLTKINVFIPQYTYKHESFYTSMNTRVYLQL